MSQAIRAALPSLSGPQAPPIIMTSPTSSTTLATACGGTTASGSHPAVSASSTETQPTGKCFGTR